MTIEELEAAIKIWLSSDPKCPKCGKIHPRKRIGNSLTFEVKVDNCDYDGPIPLNKFLG